MKNLISIKPFESILAEYREVSDKLKEIEERKNGLRLLILRELGTRKVQKLVEGDYCAAVIESVTPRVSLKTLQEKLSKATYAKVEQHVTRESVFRLSVKKV